MPWYKIPKKKKGTRVTLRMYLQLVMLYMKNEGLVANNPVGPVRPAIYKKKYCQWDTKPIHMNFSYYLLIYFSNFRLHLFLLVFSSSYYFTTKPSVRRLDRNEAKGSTPKN